MLELLAPAGAPEAVTAAVQSGADAIYLGYGAFHARRNAKNFSREEFAEAVSYCHIRGVKVYLTLNTLVTDRELPGAAAQAADASALGVDAVLVQDLGLLRLLRQSLPDLPVHASTQMTIHSLDGVKRCADLGLTRVVLARELSKDAMAHICAHSPIEIEVFAHGAMCMSYSGQCYFSSVLGGRSGNRGLCAQPCRLPYRWGDAPNGNPLSLKDLSLIDHLRELDQMGVACVKLEGRMRRPEYVAVVTSIYAAAIREARAPTADERHRLTAAFSRQGFTDGYYTGARGPAMFGVREETRPPDALFAEARAAFQGGEVQRVPVTLYALLRPDEPALVGVEDDAGRVMTAAGPIPEPARTVALDAAAVEAQLMKTGGTPYLCRRARALVAPGLSLPLSALNELRRQVLGGLTELRAAPPARRQGDVRFGVRYENRKEPPILILSLRRAGQLSDELLRLKPDFLYLPVEEIAAHGDRVARALDRGVPVAAVLPRVAWDREHPDLRRELDTAAGLGVTDALVGNLGLLSLARDAGFTLRGDFGLPCYNTQTLKELKRMGMVSATASFELKLAQIRDISKAIEIEMIVYGRLPLMLTELCTIKNHAGACVCDNVNALTDRTLASFPVAKARGCRNEVLNAKKLFLADKQADYRRVGLWGARLMFTTENPRECVQVTERYLDRGGYTPNDYTRGLYYRGVE
ncbi:MAG: U32 family peptidase [Clostridiales bacterium]|nr:U32 family peptidase [Clostridiales bacterium]